MKVLAIVRANGIRTLRDRTALFFAVLLPLILIFVLGLIYGGSGSARLGVEDDDGSDLSAALIADATATTDLRIEVRRYGSAADLRDAASRGFIQVGLVVPAGYAGAIRDGGEASVTVVAPRTTLSNAVATAVTRALATEDAIVRAARFAAGNGGTMAGALAAARAESALVPGVATTVEYVGSVSTSASSFATGAQSQLVLFIFLTALTGSRELIITRQLGISRRMLATPTPMRTILGGESVARIAVALMQGLFIIAATAVLFGVRWGDPVGTAAVVLVFAAVSGGAAMLIGALAANPSQGGALAPALGLLLALLGGAMVPAEVFPPVMRTLSYLTPHAWAMDAFRTLGDPAAGIGAILPQLAVLLGYAAVLLAIATWVLRRALSR
jgi:ABC-2 type transport system permease protein